MNNDEHIALVDFLRSKPAELEWFEFKRDNVNPEQIGEYLSALANSACLANQSHGYLVFGIDDKTHKVVGTKFDPHTAKGKGNQDLVFQLNRLLSPNVVLQYHIVEHPEGRIVLFTIDPPRNQPIRFRDKEFIRIGSNKTELRNHPEKERMLWRIFDRTPFEVGIAAEHQDSGRVLDLPALPYLLRFVASPTSRNPQRYFVEVGSR